MSSRQYPPRGPPPMTLPPPYDNLPKVMQMNSAYDVLHNLNQQRAWNDKIYAFAILNSYIRLKFYRGKTAQEVHIKLQTIEVQLPPKFGATCIEIRKVHNLPPSRVFHLVPREEAQRREFHRLGPNGTPVGSNGLPVGRSTSTTRPTAVPIAAPVTAAVPAPTRVHDPEAGEEQPPPPYAAEDPEPEATRQLQERLAADVTTSELGVNNTPQHNRTLSSSSSYRGDVPRPNEFPGSPAARAGSIHSTNTQPAQTESEQGDEERRVREESELEEALRVSRAAENERLEYEAAVRASLASAEEDAIRRSAAAGETSNAGSSTWQPPGSMGGSPAAQQQLYDSKPARPPYVSVPGAYVPQEPIPNPEYHSFNYRSAQAPNIQSDLDMLGEIDFSDNALPEPLQPVPTGQLSAQSTGMAKTLLQSRNPFLTVEEREEQQAADDAMAAGESASYSYSRAPERELPPLPSREGTESTLGPEPPSLAALGLEPRSIPSLEVQPPSRSATGQFNQQPPLGSSPPTSFGTTPPSNPSLGSSPPSTFANWKHNPMPPSGSTPQRRVSRPLPKPVGAPYAGPAVIPSSHANWDHNRSSSLSSRTSRRHASDQNAGYTPHGVLNSPPVSNFGTPPTSPPINPVNARSPSGLSVGQPSRARSPGPILDEYGENALEMLRDYHTVFLIDDSTSMAGERWEQAQTALRGVVSQAMRQGEDGVDIYFLNAKRVGRGLETSADVEELFSGLEPHGATPTGLRIEAILREYMSHLEASTDDSVRSMNLIVVTDGAFAKRRGQTAPTDDVESVIISIARRLDRGDYPLSQVGVQLLQIGDDAEATAALKELDDGLAHTHGIRDMVDTVPYSGEGITADLIVKVLLGGINRRLDRRH